eukprot:m.99502 g.99502  ORF g.99502 m.99502 type:complete len:904 (-) comp15337_c0_seq2:214-2925(-)
MAMLCVLSLSGALPLPAVLLLIVMLARLVPGSMAAMAGGPPEPFPLLHGLAADGPPVPESPDPLVQTRWTNATLASQALQVWFTRPKSVTSASPAGVFANTASLLTATPNVTVAAAAAGATLVVDFGRESAAWLELQSPDLGSAGRIALSVSEYNEPGIYNKGPTHPNKTAVPVAYGDGWYRLELNKELYEGVRFGFVHVLPEPWGQLWHITQLRIVSQVLPTNYKGSFNSSDSLLNTIWYTAAYTVKLNLLPSGFGAVLVDRGDRISWTGDAHTAQACALSAFGNYDLIRLNLNRTACTTCSNGIASYAMYFVHSVIDYFLATGDETTLRAYQPVVAAKLAVAVGKWNCSASLRFYGSDDRIGADFEYPSAPESQNAFAMLVIRTLRRWAAAVTACRSCSHAGVPDFVITATNLTARARSSGAHWHDTYGLHAAAGAILANVTTPTEKEILFQREFTNPVNICSFSLFNMYFVIQAMEASGHRAEALQAIARCWGAPLVLGATSFWETSSPEWTRFLQPHDAIPNGQTGYTSMCHPWASGVAHWLTSSALGLQATSPGWVRFEFRPLIVLEQQPGGPRPLPWLQGSVPTPHGVVRAGFDARGLLAGAGAGTWAKGFVALPNGTECVVVLPPLCDGVSSVLVNGRLVADDALAPFHLGAGHHRVRVKYRGCGLGLRSPPTVLAPHRDAVPPLPPASAYPARVLGMDRETSGSWRGRYGTQGYALFSWGKAGRDVVKIPADGPRVLVRKDLVAPRATALAVLTNDTRALQAPPQDVANAIDRDEVQNLGVYATRNPLATLQTFLIDVLPAVGVAGGADRAAVAKTPYKVSLYFCDWFRQGTRQVVEARDPLTRELVAPTQYVTGFENGTYVSWQVEGGIRFRINQLRNGDASVSALFLDSAPMA